MLVYQRVTQEGFRATKQEHHGAFLFAFVTEFVEFGAKIVLMLCPWP